MALGEGSGSSAGWVVQSFVGDSTWSGVGVEGFDQESGAGDGDGW